MVLIYVVSVLPVVPVPTGIGLSPLSAWVVTPHRLGCRPSFVQSCLGRGGWVVAPLVVEVELVDRCRIASVAASLRRHRHHNPLFLQPANVALSRSLVFESRLARTRKENVNKKQVGGAKSGLD
jgi:hypothetical protein